MENNFDEFFLVRVKQREKFFFGVDVTRRRMSEEWVPFPGLEWRRNMKSASNESKQMLINFDFC